MLSPFLPSPLTEKFEEPVNTFAVGSSARLWPSGGPAECIGKALAQGAGSFLHLLSATRDAPARVRPVVRTQGGERLGKGGPRLGLASLLWKGPRAWADESIGEQGDPRKDSQHAQPRACHGAIVPGALAFHPESSWRFLKGPLPLPASHEPGHNGAWAVAQIRTPPGRWVEARGGVPEQH